MKILLVDDSKSARYALRLQLQRHGVEVETAESAEVALELLKGELPDAILMDHMMPGLNGFEALEIIRSDPRTAPIPVVMCSSHEDSDFVAAAQRKGVVAILPKSVAPERLPDILAQLQRLTAQTAETVQTVPAPPPSQPTPVAAAPTLTTRPPPVAAAPTAAAVPDLLHQIEGQISALVNEGIEARLSKLMEPLLLDLKRDLHERLLAEARHLVESRVAESGEALETRLREEHRMASNALADATQAQVRTAVDRLAATTLPELLKDEIETERGQVLELVDQYLREFSPRNAVDQDASGVRVAALDDAILAKAKEAARREATEACGDAMDRTRQMTDSVVQQVHARLTRIYIGIGAAAVIGVVAASIVYFMVR